jgi:hypothetical protein
MGARPTIRRVSWPLGAEMMSEDAKFAHARLEPRRHVFRVRAKDAADNVDATPATDSWRVKKS